jgi:hypothetical protein
MVKQMLRKMAMAAHTRMPDFSLSRYERDALVAYILSLR